MRKTLPAFITIFFWLIVTNSKINSAGFQPPQLTDYAQSLIETLRIGPLDERVRAIEICGINGYIPCYYTLVSLLKDVEPVIRKKSAISLGLLRNKDAMIHIEKAMEAEKDESVQADFIRSLMFFKSVDSTKIAEKYIGSESEKIRFVAVKVLTIASDETLYDKISERIKVENSEHVKVMLLHAALKIKKTSANITELVRFFTSTQRIVRLYAAKAAEDLKLKETLLPLKKALILEDDPEVREEFHHAYDQTYIK